jgi:hypothetical protein
MYVECMPYAGRTYACNQSTPTRNTNTEYDRIGHGSGGIAASRAPTLSPHDDYVRRRTRAEIHLHRWNGWLKAFRHRQTN